MAEEHRGREQSLRSFPRAAVVVEEEGPSGYEKVQRNR